MVKIFICGHLKSVTRPPYKDSTIIRLLCDQCRNKQKPIIAACAPVARNVDRLLLKKPA